MLKESGNPLKNIPQVREGGTDTQVSHILTPPVKTPNQNVGLKCYLYVQYNQTEAFSIHPQGMTQNAPNNPALYYASFHPTNYTFQEEKKILGQNGGEDGHVIKTGKRNFRVLLIVL